MVRVKYLPQISVYMHRQVLIIYIQRKRKKEKTNKQKNKAKQPLHLCVPQKCTRFNEIPYTASGKTCAH